MLHVQHTVKVRGRAINAAIAATMGYGAGLVVFAVAVVLWF
jgi:hypothetical protein